MRILFLTLGLMMATALSAQYTSGFQVEYFYGNLPSAKTEAMGMADAAIGGTIASTFFNAAGLGSIDNQEIYLSTSAPFYILKNSNYYYAGYARRVMPWLVTAFSVNNFVFGENDNGWVVDIGYDDYLVTKGLTSNYALSVAGTPVKGLYIGFNFNFYRWKLFTDVSAAKTFNMDGGILYKLEIPEFKKIRSHAQFGVSVNNFTMSKITYEAPDGAQATNELPIIGRFAAAYMFGTDVNLPAAGSGPLDFTFTMEYQANFNSEYYNIFSVGVESVLWQVLAFRMGWFTQSLDDFGNETNYDRIRDFTYGFGAIVPLNKLTGEKVPLKIHFDYCSLKPPSHSDHSSKASTGRLVNMRTFTLRVAWTLMNN
jgi:hypothetical protein